MSADRTVYEPDASATRRPARVLDAFAFNLLLVVGCAFPVTLGVAWSGRMLWGADPREAWITVIVYVLGILPVIVLGAAYVIVVMALARWALEWRRRIAAGASTLVVVFTSLRIEEPGPLDQWLPYWLGLIAGMAVLAVALEVDDAPLPPWKTWIVIILPTPLLAALTIGVLLLPGRAEGPADEKGREPGHGIVDTARVSRNGAGR